MIGDLILRMRRDGDDGDVALVGTVAPKYAVSAGGSVLGVGFKYGIARSIGMFQRIVLVSFQAGMTRIV